MGTCRRLTDGDEDFVDDGSGGDGDEVPAALRRRGVEDGVRLDETRSGARSVGSGTASSDSYRRPFDAKLRRRRRRALPADVVIPCEGEVDPRGR